MWFTDFQCLNTCRSFFFWLLIIRIRVGCLMDFSWFDYLLGIRLTYIRSVYKKQRDNMFSLSSARTGSCSQGGAPTLSHRVIRGLRKPSTTWLLRLKKTKQKKTTLWVLVVVSVFFVSGKWQRRLFPCVGHLSGLWGAHHSNGWTVGSDTHQHQRRVSASEPHRRYGGLCLKPDLLYFCLHSQKTCGGFIISILRPFI